MVIFIYSVLLGRANTWLSENPAWKVINCETVESKLTWSMGQPLAADTMTSTYYEPGKASTVYNKSLRLVDYRYFNIQQV